MARQYSGTLGKVGNCQVGVFLACAAPRGPAPTRHILDPAGAQPQPVAALLAGLAGDTWRELTVAEGAQGPRRYAFAAMRVWESRAGHPGRACWLLLRRNRDGGEPKCYLSNAPADTPPLTLARVSAARWCIETGFRQGKGEAELDEYETRSWGGWHRHITLALLALAFLLTLRQGWGEKDGPTRADAPPGRPSAAPPPPAPPLGHGRPGPLAGHHPGAQRPRAAVPRPPARGAAA